MSRTDDRPLLVVASGDTAGWIVPCGCTSNQSGGMLRRGTYIGQLRTDAHVLYVDAGGTASGESPYDRAKFEAILRGEMALDVVAHNIGASEAALGADYLRSLHHTLGVPFVTCNVRDSAGELLGEPVRVIKSTRGRVAFIGVLSDSYHPVRLQIDPPREAILQTLADIDQRPDSLVVLAYLPTAELESLANSLPEVDVVIGGPTLQCIVPHRIGPTLLTSATSKGKYLAELSAPVMLRGGQWSGTIVEMNERFADELSQKETLREFYATLRERDFAASQTSFVTDLEFPKEFLVAGTQRCRECHEDDCLLWEASRHAHAWQTLADAGAEIDSYCQQCHTTSYGIPGGFVSATRSQNRRDVGCESCHGASYSHCEDSEVHTTYYGRARDQCLRCHDRENSPEFVYDTYWQKIVHGGEEASSAVLHQDRLAEQSEGVH